jgi:hypothetical protein
MLNVFGSDAFSVTSLTAAFIKVPFKPARLGQLGLFSEKSIRTKTVAVEEKNGRLSLITSSPRGGVGTTIGAQKRTARSFTVPHFEAESKVMADEVQDLRSFGANDDTTDAVADVVNERMTDLRASHEVTLEYLRLGALQGIILDGDGSSTLYNLFTEFGVSQQVQDFQFSSATLDVRGLCIAVERLIENELGGSPVTGYRAFCGDSWFDTMVKHANVVNTLLYQESGFLRTDFRNPALPTPQGGLRMFEFGGIVFENYRGSVGGVSFIDTNQAFVFPEGTDIFQTYFAPADFAETVNTPGLPLYAKIAPGELNRFAKIHTQSNPLPLCLRPRAVVKLTKS